jgi:glutaredoxin
VIKIPIPVSDFIDARTNRISKEWNDFLDQVGDVSSLLETLPSGNIWVGDAGSTPVPQIITGDISLSSGGVTTLDTVNSDVGTYGSTTQVPVVTVNGKGLVTAVTEVDVAGLPKDTYIDEEFTVPLYCQLILYQTLTLIGTASIDAIGTVVLI